MHRPATAVCCLRIIIKTVPRDSPRGISTIIVPQGKYDHGSGILGRSKSPSDFHIEILKKKLNGEE